MANKCPRCEGLVTQVYVSEQPTCSVCGWADYKYHAPRLSSKADAWGGASLRLRYIGSNETDYLPSRRGTDHSQIRDFVVTVIAESVPRLNHQGERLLVRPLCPFCEDRAPMEKKSMRSQRLKRSEERFICPSKHMIGLVSQTREGGEQGHFVGWR